MENNNNGLSNGCSKKSMKPFHIETPLIESVQLSEIVGLPVHLKCENCQPSGSFKLRGMGYFIQKSYENGTRCVVTASGGNAGLATAYSARKMGIPATVVVPESTPKDAIRQLKELKANVIVHGKEFDEANEEAFRRAEQPGNTYVPPFDHPLVWQGYVSMVTEIRDQLRGLKPRCIVVAVGGAGLLLGTILGLRECNWEDVPIIAMETEGAASFHGSLVAEKLITLPRITSIAYCLGAKTVCKQAVEIALNKEHTIISRLVSDKEAVDACHQFLDHHRFLVEPSCGAGLAAGYAGIVREAYKEGLLLESGPVVIIVCGGATVHHNLLMKYKETFDKII